MTRWLAIAVLTAGCTTKGIIAPPTLGKQATVGPDLTICVPVDVRAQPERRGRIAGTAGWTFADVYEFTHHRGSVITRDIGLAPIAPGDDAGDGTRPAVLLAESLRVGLSRSGHFASVEVSGSCGETPAEPSQGALLWVRLDHGYGSGFLVSKRWTYPISSWGNQVQTRTVREHSAAPLVGYARASMAYCTSGGCVESTEYGQQAETATNARPGESTRSRLNILFGKAMSELAAAISRRAISQSGPAR
ncbi:MAG: hypothetical protein KC912_01770 [Proteobacteria bacterium]|nr:hypothetical protein [Pseudomonadota bacterium]